MIVIVLPDLPTENDLLEKASQGSQEALRQIYTAYFQPIYQFIRLRVGDAHLAEDLTSEVFLDFVGAVKGRNPGPKQNLRGWLFRVARNKITDRYRKRKTTALGDLEYENEDGSIGFRAILAADDHDPDLAELKRIFWEELMAALDELPAEQREAFVLNEIEEVTLQEIADRAGKPLKTIISRKRYAVTKLRERLREVYNELFN